MSADKPIELNVGGRYYTTSLSSLTQEPDSQLALWFKDPKLCSLHSDMNGRFFIDRDGHLFRFILDYLRQLRTDSSSETNDLATVGSGDGLVGVADQILTEQLSAVGQSGSTCSSPSAIDDSTGDSVSASTVGMLNFSLLTRESTDLDITHKLLLPDGFTERARLREEASFYKLQGLVNWLDATSPRGYVKRALAGSPASTITVTYRGTYASGRDGLADIKFRKLTRILVCGRGSYCREVFGESLNDSRDPDRGPADDRYSSRYFLKHSILELALDKLYEAGYRLIGCCGTGANNPVIRGQSGLDWDESKWQHCHEFIFVRSNW